MASQQKTPLFDFRVPAFRVALTVAVLWIVGILIFAFVGDGFTSGFQQWTVRSYERECGAPFWGEAAVSESVCGWLRWTRASDLEKFADGLKMMLFYALFPPIGLLALSGSWRGIIDRAKRQWERYVRWVQQG